MSDSLEFTGERFTPECEREIWYEHYHRYALASRWCIDKHTLDAACGEGYGSSMLARSAASVEGVDISPEAIEHARQRYGQQQNVNFQVADCTK
ncbi:MAG: class I SAM-dependent methyltransferase, partial [Lysobacterales bacterium]